MLDVATIRAIADWGPDEVVTSLYLDVDGRRFPRPSDVARRAHLLVRSTRQLARRGEVGPANQVEAELGAIERWLGTGFDRRTTRGLALFAGAADGRFEVLPLNFPVRDQVVVDRAPDVAPLCLALAAAPPALLVVTDGRQALVAVWDEGVLEELERLDDVLPRQVDVDVEMGGFGHHHEELARQHFRRVARRVAEQTEGREFRHVLVGGPGTSAAQLVAQLPERIAALVGDRLDLSMESTPRELAAAATSAVARAEARRTAALVEEVRGHVATGTGAAAGLAATLGAVGDGEVRTLVVETGFGAAGARCATCHLLVADEGACPRCGAAVAPVANVVDAAVTEAFLHGAEVVPAPEGALEAEGHVAALLTGWAAAASGDGPGGRAGA